MKVIVRISKSFKRQAKPLLKKFASLSKELTQLEEDLIKNPQLGKSLGHGAYKIRLATESKGKGKSGGLRIISHVCPEIIGVIEKDGDVIFVTLIAIYDKSETASISDKELKNLINKIRV
ncbi:MAG: addiction module toxin RelE [Bacteroidota bacterium]|nr:addiction module toxin RelE [Bacteroidota bacterium]